MPSTVDFLIIGGGVVGVAIGIEILKKNPSAAVLLVEKEPATGAHASGRNSGVLHAGFYYSPDSLKAKFCLEGNHELRQIIKFNSLPLNQCGKVVVAQSEEDLPRLMKLYERGIANGTRLELLSEKDLPKFEPLAKTYKNFLWSPDTAVGDPKLVNQKMLESFQSLGGTIQTNSVVSLASDQVAVINDTPISVGKIVNASGANAIHLAHSVGVGLDYAQLPVLGLYKITKRNSLPLKTLVYPVPNPMNPFLGVHFTLTVDGSVKIGPTAIPILGREQYSKHEMPDLLDLVESAKALRALATKSRAELFRLTRTELPKALTSVLIREGMKLVPSLDPEIVWRKKKPGIRAQLVNLNSGTFEMDFVVRESGKVVHVLNAVSPGWTSSIPFAKWIVSKYLV